MIELLIGLAIGAFLGGVIAWNWENLFHTCPERCHQKGYRACCSFCNYKFKKL